MKERERQQACLPLPKRFYFSRFFPSLLHFSSKTTKKSPKSVTFFDFSTFAQLFAILLIVKVNIMQQDFVFSYTCSECNSSTRKRRQFPKKCKPRGRGGRGKIKNGRGKKNLASPVTRTEIRTTAPKL